VQRIVLKDLQQGTAVLVPVGGQLSLGRDSSQVDRACPEQHVSRRHCELHGLEGGMLRVVDLGSSEGTFINGARVEGEGTVGAQGVITLGRDFNLQVLGAVAPPGGVGVAGDVDPPWWFNDHLLLLSVLGKGGMGVVYEAWDQRHDRPCAIKWLRAKAPVGLDRTQRFQRETSVMEELGQHPGIVSVYESGRSPGGELFCAMELVPGVALDRAVSEGISRLEGVRIVEKTCRAVAYAHEHGVIHRDLKPGNVLVTPEGHVRLTDFGIAKALEDDIGITRSGVQLGTPPFMAPEQVVDSKAVDVATDVYGLGAILYFVLTGRPPIQGRGVRQVLDRALLGIITKPSKVDPSIDGGLEAICLRALKSEPQQRFETADKMADALTAWLREQDPPAKVSLSAPS
jgi:serine/threonine protein kinase